MSMIETSKACFPSSLPAFLVEHRTISPMVQSLAEPRVALARQRLAQPQNRRSGGSKVIEGVFVEAFTLEGSSGRPASRMGTSNGSVSDTSSDSSSRRGSGGKIGRSVDNKANIGSSSSSSRDWPTNEYYCTLDEESRPTKTQDVRTNQSIAGGGRTRFHSRGGCGEAWGSTGVMGAKSAEGTQSKAGSSRGGKSTVNSDVWAWTGFGGYAARGNAMLSAYGLQPYKHNPTCPSGTPGTGTSRRGRWQRVNGVGSRENRGASAGDGWEKGSVWNDESENGCGGSGGGGRSEEKTSERTTPVQGQKFRGGKGRKQRLSVVPGRASWSSRRSGYRSSAVGRVAGALCTREQSRSIPQTTATSPHEPINCEVSGDLQEESDRYSAGKIRRAYMNRHAPSSDVAENAEQSIPQPHADDQDHKTVEADVSAASLSTQVETPTMDGRGGTAAPPHRPHQLTLVAPATSASYSAVFPDLKTTGRAEGEITVVFESNCSRRQGSGWGNDNCSNTQISVTRRRDRSHNSSWNAKTNSPNCAGKHYIGSGSDRSHHHRRARSLMGEWKSDSKARPEAFASSEPTYAGTGHSFNKAAEDVLALGVPTVGGEAVERPLIAPPLALVEHFKQTPRPASRRGTRKQGADRDATPPAPALCLFSGHRGDRDERFGRTGATLERRRKG